METTEVRAKKGIIVYFIVRTWSKYDVVVYKRLLIYTYACMGSRGRLLLPI